MNRETLRTEVTEIFRMIFDDPALVITDATSAEDIEDWDSLEQINILMAMEKRFSVRFSVADVENLRNVGETMDLIERRMRDE